MRARWHSFLMLSALVFGCATIIGLDGWRTLEARRDAIHADQNETANLAQSLSQHAHDSFHLVEIVLQVLRERAEVDGLTESHIERLRSNMLARVTSSPSTSGLFIYDANGNWIVNTKTNVPNGMNNRDRGYFEYHRTHADRNMFIGKPVLSKADGIWVMTASLRLDDAHGRFAGVVLATVPVSYLADFYKSFDMGRTGSITLAMAGGTLIARNPSDLSMTGRDLSGSQIFRKFLPKADIASYQYSSLIDGTVRLGSHRRVQDFPFVIIIGHGLQEVLAGWRLTAWLHTAISLVLAAALGLIGWKVMLQSNRIRRAERHYRLLADNSSDAIICVALDGRRLYVSPAFTTLTGWPVEEMMKMGWGEIVHPDDQESSREIASRLRSGETNLSSAYRYICKSGDVLWVEARLNLVPATKDEEAQYVIAILDISERKKVEEQLAASYRELEVQARTDGLTGIANRRRFDEALDEEWRRGMRDQTPLSLLMIDVDRFKLFNDHFGHTAGDVCLARVAATIAKCVHRPGDLVARYGGEEMSAILPNTSPSGALEIAETIRATVQNLQIAHDSNSPAGVVTVSIGVATRFLQSINDKDGGGTLALTAQADAALYQSKNTGRNKVSGEGDLPAAGSPPRLANEPERLAAVTSYGFNENEPSMDSMDRLARLTSGLFEAPIAMVSIVGSERQCFIGRFGLDASGIPREVSFCAHAIAGQGVFTVADATADVRFADNPLVTGEPHIRFYAGAPLIGARGHNLGALCIVDQKSRLPLSPSQKALLQDLADLASNYLDQQRAMNSITSECLL